MEYMAPNAIRSVALRLRIRPAEANKLRELAAQDDEPVSAVVRRAIRRYIEDADRTDHKRMERR
jgi:predicted transcriptional regulator